MASEREAAKNAITERGETDPELGETLTGAHQFQLELTKETNRHNEAMRKSDLGYFGGLLGGEKSAPVTVALLVVLLGFGVGIGCLIAASNANEPGIWFQQAERGFSIGLAALAYIFGKGGR